MFYQIELFLKLLFIGVLIRAIKSESFEVIDIENGKIRGELRDNYYAFEGIPYAEAPLGELRFAPTKPLKEKWDGIRNFNKFGAECMQWDHLIHGEDRLRGSEDCLFLNVYVPKTVLESKNKEVPVFFYIHGGAFMFGGSNSYSPKQFMTKDVILVTFNYRLGPLGFLSTEDNAISGNMGMKDQVMALKWTNENIAKFQGDRESITLLGFSAGGASVHLFYLSTMTKGLFKNGISYSGCALNPWVIAENSKEKAHKIAENVGCPTENHEELLKCLKQKPAGDIVRSVKLFQPFLYNPFSPFGVVVEKSDGEVFLSDFPSILLKNEKFHKIPWLATATKDEGLYPAAEFYDKEHLDWIDSKWDSLAPHLFDFNHTFTDESKKLEISRRIREHYMETEDNCHRVSMKYFSELRDIFSDRLYNYGIRNALYLQSEFSPVNFYLFDHKISYGLGEKMSGLADIDLGISHGEDIVLLFRLVREGPGHPPLNEKEILMCDKLLDMIINFNQNEELAFNGQRMRTMTKERKNYLIIKNVDDFYADRLDDFGNGKFWDEILHDHVMEN